MEHSLRTSGDPPGGTFEVGDAVRVTESLQLRTSPSTSGTSIAVMPAGTTGEVVGGPETGSGYTWWQISTSYGTGWAVQDWLVDADGGRTPPVSRFAAGDTVRVAENLNMRSGPSTLNGVVTVLPAGTTGTIVGGPRSGAGYTWWRVETSHGTGWVVETWLTSDGSTPPVGRFAAGDTVRLIENMNARSGPGTGSDIVTVLPAGTVGRVLEGPRAESGYSWWRIESPRGTGWVAENWLVEHMRETLPPSALTFRQGDAIRVTENLNLRTGASTAAGVVVVLPIGTAGTVVGGPQTGSGYRWWRIDTSLGAGWVVENWIAAA